MVIVVIKAFSVPITAKRQHVWTLSLFLFSGFILLPQQRFSSSNCFLLVDGEASNMTSRPELFLQGMQCSHGYCQAGKDAYPTVKAVSQTAMRSALNLKAFIKSRTVLQPFQ